MNWKTLLLLALTACAQTTYELPCRDAACTSRMDECARACRHEASMACPAAFESECVSKCRFDTDVTIRCRAVANTCEMAAACRIR